MKGDSIMEYLLEEYGDVIICITGLAIAFTFLDCISIKLLIYIKYLYQPPSILSASIAYIFIIDNINTIAMHVSPNFSNIKSMPSLSPPLILPAANLYLLVTNDILFHLINV